MKAVVKHTISLDGVIYNPGDTIELNAEQAKQLADNLDHKATPGEKAGAAKKEDDTTKSPSLKKKTNDELAKILTDAKIDFDPNSKKSDLIDLIESNINAYAPVGDGDEEKEEI
jgi:hypothetical protein